MVMRFITHLAELSFLGKIPDISEAVTSPIGTRQAAKDSARIRLCGDVLLSGCETEDRLIMFVC